MGLTTTPKKKFILLNALRGLALISLIFVLAANAVMLAQDARAKAPDKDHEDCDYLEDSSVPNQPLGKFRAFLSLIVNLILCIILMLAELDLPKMLFRDWLTMLGTDSLVPIGIFEFLFAVQMMSHFLETFPLVASFFLLIASCMNILTWRWVDRPRTFRAWGVWNELKEPGMAPSSAYNTGFARNASDHSRLASPPNALLSRQISGSHGTLPLYSSNSSIRSSGPFTDEKH